MKFLLKTILFSLIGLNLSLSADCSQKILDSITDGIVDKLNANIPITREYINEILDYCPVDSTISSDYSERSSVCEIISQDQSAPKELKNFANLCQEINQSSPKQGKILEIILEQVTGKVQKTEKRHKQLDDWKRSSAPLPLLDDTQILNDTQTQLINPQKDVPLDFYREADKNLSKSLG